MNGSRSFLVLSLAVLLSGCATSMKTYRASGTPTICTAQNDLGTVAVLPETAWRSDQKEPELRQKMAARAINTAFTVFPCGRLTPPGGIAAFANWSALPQPILLKQYADKGIDTLILLRMEELTPNLFFTFSLPFLWAGSNEADFQVRVLSTADASVYNDIRINMVTGGPFHIRPAQWSEDLFQQALTAIIVDQK